MTWWQVLIAWLVHAAGLASLSVGQEVESPPFFTTFADGKQFANTIKSKRVA